MIKIYGAKAQLKILCDITAPALRLGLIEALVAWAKARLNILRNTAPAWRLGTIRIIMTWALAHIICLYGNAQKEVSQVVMQKIYDEIKTPYKY